MKATVARLERRCESESEDCRYWATHSVVLGALGPFGAYCERHAHEVAHMVNVDDANRVKTSEDSAR